MNVTLVTRQVVWRENNRDKANAQSLSYYHAHKDEVSARVLARRAITRERIRAIKLELGCAGCGYNAHAAALDFDHVRGEKVAGVSRMISWPWGRIEAEIEKCEVVCANCHRIRTEERGYKS